MVGTVDILKVAGGAFLVGVLVGIIVFYLFLCYIGKDKK